MSENFSLGGLRKKIDLSKLKGGLKAEQFDFGKKDKLKSVFEQIDTTPDGVITQEELEAYIEKLHTAAGADNKLNRKEAKAAGLGSRKDINKFLKQAIELSKGIKTEFTPDAEPQVSTPDVATPDITEPEVVHTEPLADEPPVLPDTVVDTDGDTVGDDEGDTTEELTPQDALKNLFGDKKKASVKIDGSATGLSSKPYTGQVILPNGETIEDGAFPENLRITLPPSYGENATMKLKLIDPENGIYESSAKDRNFQIVTDENGNVTIQSVNIEELQCKLDANLAEYARLEAERQAALEQAGGDGTVDGDDGKQPLSKEELLAVSKKQQEARALASELFDACDSQNFAVGRERFQTALHQVNKDNISMVLSQYNDLHPDESLVDTICSEMGSGRKDALTYLMGQLAEAARERGIPEADITKATKEFEVSMNAEFRKAGFINPAKMENSMNFLHGLILGADLNAGDMDEADAINTITGAAADTYDTAKSTYDAARAEEGWIARTGDNVLGWFGCTTKEDMDTKLGAYKADVERLQNAKTEAEFKAAYEDTFGVPFDSKKVAAYETALSDYSMANGYKTQMDKLRNLWADGSTYDSYESYRDAFSSALKTDNFEISADEIDTMVNEYMAANPKITDKQEALQKIASDMMVKQEEQFNQIAKGRTIEQMSAEVDTVRQGAFGTRDIVNDVIKYNANQQMTEMVFEAAGEIAVTAALMAVPGAGAIAAAKLAASAARWGSRGLKVAKYATKAQTAFARVNTAINTGRSANIVRAKKTTANAAAAFTGTTAVDLSNGKSVKEALRKGLMNATFAGAGAMSGELAPVLAKTYGISNKVAKEIAEEITERAMDVGSSAGISAAFNGGYSKDEAFLDLATGLIMNRLGKLKGNTDAPAPAVTPSKLDIATSNNSSVPGGKLSEQNFEQVKQEVRDELAAGATPTRAAEIHSEADKLQIQSRHQSREIKHIVEDAFSVYDSPSLGKIDLTKETDLKKLAQAKKEISQWFDGKKDVRGDAARNRQAMLDKIDARMAELNAAPNLQGKKVESEIVDRMNTNTERDAASVLANEGKPLSPHGAATLDDKIKLTNTVEELEAMKKQLESRVGYQVQGIDHAAATIKKIDTKINSIKAHQADFAATTGRIDDAISAGKGLNAEDLQTIRAFMEKSNSADELKQIADKMSSSKPIRSYGGSKKLIADINNKIEFLNTKNAALAAADTHAGTPTGAAADAANAHYIDESPLAKSETPAVETPVAKPETPATDAPAAETPVAKPETPATDAPEAPKADAPAAKVKSGEYSKNGAGFIEPENYKDMSPDELVAEYKNLKEYEDESRDVISPLTGQIVKNHDTSASRNAIQAELDKRGFKFENGQLIDKKTNQVVKVEPPKVETPKADAPEADAQKVEVRKPTERELKELKQMQDAIKNAKTPEDIFYWQRGLDEYPDCPEKASLEKAMSEKLNQMFGVTPKAEVERGAQPVSSESVKIVDGWEIHTDSKGNQYSLWEFEDRSGTYTRGILNSQKESAAKILNQLSDGKEHLIPDSNNITATQGSDGSITFKINNDSPKLNSSNSDIRIYRDGHVMAYRGKGEIQAQPGDLVYVYADQWGHLGQIIEIPAQKVDVNAATPKNSAPDKKKDVDKALLKEINDNLLANAKDYKNAASGTELPLTPVIVSSDMKINLGGQYELDLNSPQIKSLKDGESLTVGRKGDIKVPNECNQVSREHLTITKVGDQLIVKDISTNGSTISGTSADNIAAVKVNSEPVENNSEAVEVVEVEHHRQLSSADRIEIAKIGNDINNIKTFEDIDKLQKRIDKLPDGTQKTHLQRQLDKQKEKLNEAVAWVDVDGQSSNIKRNDSNQDIIDANNLAAYDAAMAAQMNNDNLFDSFDVPDDNMLF